MIPKKVRFKDKKDGMSNDMVVEMISEQPTSWRDMLVVHSSNDGFNNSGEKDTIDIVEGDIQKSVVNGVPSITFSDRIHQIFIQGPWTIFGQYLTVQPWTMAFDPTQAYPSVVMAWIRFPTLLSYLYNRKIITEIGELVEYESLSTIYFHCGWYGHVENICNFKSTESMAEGNRGSPKAEPEIQNLNVEEPEKKDGNFGPWMIVERKSKRKPRDSQQKLSEFYEKDKEGSRFSSSKNIEMQDREMADF
ncbi:hypothetical protein GOBAR_AA17745 [Gossypium barbadense]|uniref:Uncharacterized protein n=1 Tax=Gossypium barbadense TaxID=3634 RepID=A0A2P5XHV2_GOSBA|nr:hypothetical protein GOBAR_AA17745 [Gossypium barbadense]